MRKNTYISIVLNFLHNIDKIDKLIKLSLLYLSIIK